MKLKKERYGFKMTIMDMVRKVSGNRHELKEKFKKMQEDDRLQEMLENRKKSSNQRELEKHIKKEHEKKIKVEIDKIRKQQTKDTWCSKNNILKEKSTMLTDNKKLLHGGKSILAQKNIFLDHKADIPMTKKEMFFKW